MIVYIRKTGGGLYASPIFAEFKTRWDAKSVVLDESQKQLMLLNDNDENGRFNLIDLDENIDEGWEEKGDNICGFPEIIENEQMIKDLLDGKKVPIEGLECVKKYKLPLEVKTKFRVENEKDMETFATLCWRLRDAYIARYFRVDNDLVIDFDTTWDKHIVMTFYDVIEEKNIGKFLHLNSSEFHFGDNAIKWVSQDFVTLFDEEDMDEVSITAKEISYRLKVKDL